MTSRRWCTRCCKRQRISSSPHVLAYKAAGAHGVVAEPLAGLLSPALAEEFSEPYVRQMAQAAKSDDFIVIYHNCGNNTPRMMDSILRTECDGYHFGRGEHGGAGGPGAG